MADLSDFYLKNSDGTEVVHQIGDPVLDSNGVPVVDENNDPVLYTEVTYIFADRPNTKTRNDVLDTIAKFKGTRDDIIDGMIELYSTELQWNWFNRYQQYEALVATILEYNSSLPIVTGTDENGDDVIDNTPKDIPAEPVRPNVITPEQWKLDNYAVLREAAYPSQEKQFEMMFDDKINATTKWDDSINAVKAQYPKPV